VTGTYRAVVLTRQGGPEVLEVKQFPIEEPGPKQLRVRVHATGVGATDLAMLAGKYLFAPKMPFVPGYEIAGIVDAIGIHVSGFQLGQRVAALTVYGGYSEGIVREAEHFLPIPDQVSDVAAAATILNYITAWQMIHRTAKVRPGQTALVTAAAGGVGTALLQLLRLAGVKTYGAASAKKHGTVRELGATPIDYTAGALDHLMRALEPQGVDYVFDAVGGANIGLCIGAARRGGTVVSYGFLAARGALATLAMFIHLFAGSRLRARRGAFYGITYLYRKDPTLLREDLPKIFTLIAEQKITPLVSTLPLLAAKQALELLAAGSVEGKIVLTNT
jgi:NADPH:quinone reductase